jgi:hypothetical protein
VVVQPDNVRGKLGDLRGVQANAGAQLLGAAEGGACRHERHVLRLITAVAPGSIWATKLFTCLGVYLSPR